MKDFWEKQLIKCIDKQLSLNWYRAKFKDLQKLEWWYNIYVTNNKIENKYRKFLKRYLRKYLPKSIIDKEIGYFILNFWFKNIDNIINK